MRSGQVVAVKCQHPLQRAGSPRRLLQPGLHVNLTRVYLLVVDIPENSDRAMRSLRAKLMTVRSQPPGRDWMAVMEITSKEADAANSDGQRSSINSVTPGGDLGRMTPVVPARRRACVQAQARERDDTNLLPPRLDRVPSDLADNEPSTQRATSAVRRPGRERTQQAAGADLTARRRAGYRRAFRARPPAGPTAARAICPAGYRQCPAVLVRQLGT